MIRFTAKVEIKGHVSECSRTTHLPSPSFSISSFCSFESGKYEKTRYIWTCLQPIGDP